jgi:hypothetical protein
MVFTGLQISEFQIRGYIPVVFSCKENDFS